VILLHILIACCFQIKKKNTPTHLYEGDSVSQGSENINLFFLRHETLQLDKDKP
jgi:hypothetical protein